MYLCDVAIRAAHATLICHHKYSRIITVQYTSIFTYARRRHANYAWMLRQAKIQLRNETTVQLKAEWR